MKKIGITFAVLLLALIGFILFNTLTSKSKQLAIAPLPTVPVSDSVITHLQQAIRFKTVSYDHKPADTVEFAAFHAFLQKNFPLFHSRLKMEKVNNYALLFTWKGKNPAFKPIILMAHQDVVPVEESSRNLWEAAPFGGELKNGFVWGRGAVDDKGSLMAILEGAEKLLQENYQPASDIYFVFSNDEETLGSGARKIAALLQRRNVKPALVLDEGGIITSKQIPGMQKPVALIGIAEKGYVTLDLKVAFPGGHSSMPGPETAIDILASAVLKLKTNPFPATVSPVVDAFMDYLGPEMPFTQKMAFANRTLFSPLIKKNYSSKPGANATIRTTTATTIFNAGVKENVIPANAEATVNFRTLPGTTTEDVIKHVTQTINDSRVKLKLHPVSSSPAAIADVNDVSFSYMQKAIKSWDKNLITTPYLVLGATDGRYLTTLTPQVFRFIPFHDIQGFHGVNERVGVTEYKKAIGFYYNFIKQYSGK